ncbi:putative oxidoreductase [Stieleria bergensis]|uniref:Putative oxidoreductase n=1 Tax=Stieleria bergensis TaxID=2528025 RepID=A0A517SPN4_9BACT|nr:putative oxidoreductase [Planctomycetes bacterium SV_7m_r]
MPETSPVVLVTGGSAGLGKIIAKTFLNAGYRVMIVGRSTERLQNAADELDGGDRLAIATCDVSELAQCHELAEQINTQFGRLDTLVNCIGTSDRGVVTELTADRLKQLWQDNVLTTLHCSQAMLILLEQSHGSIVNIGSLAGKVGARYLGGYVTAKHALTGLTQQMRLEWRDRDVHVALVSPGPIRRPDAGQRYAQHNSEALPESASAPGGGTKVKGLPPETVAAAVLKCAQRKKTDLVLPGHLRCLIAIGNAFPRLGDWLLLKFSR